MNRFFIFLIGIMAAVTATGQNGLTQIWGAKSSAMGFMGASITGHDAIYHNPAGMVHISKFSLKITSEQRYVIEELNASSISWMNKLDPYSAIGVYLGNFGLDDYRELKFAFGYSRKLSEIFSLGTRMDYNRLSISEYGAKSNFVLHLGVQTQLSRELLLGMHFSNPWKNTLTGSTGLDNFVSVGMTYKPSENVGIYAQISKVLDREEQYHFGVEYKLTDALVVRAGNRSNPTIFSFGIGYRFNPHFQMDGGFTEHPHLGYTPSLSLGYQK